MNFFTGFLVGVVSLVPGISGGTILVLMKKYESITKAIANFKEKKSRMILFSLVLGIFVGTITFARVIELLFYLIPNATFVLFSGFVLFQIPSFIKSEEINIKPFWLFLGALFIYLLSLFHVDTTVVILEYPAITFFFLLSFSVCGMIDGFFTILPGVSGSMIMMILGPYFLYKSYLANLSLQTLIFVVPLLFYFVGDAIGFYFGSKFSLFCLKKHRGLFLNLVLGMVLMSALLLLPIPDFSFDSLLFFAIPLFMSYLFCRILKHFN